MKNKKKFYVAFLVCVISIFSANYSFASETTSTSYVGSFTLPESQPGYYAETYERKAVSKLQRGAENFFLCFLEVPQGIKRQAAERKAEYLPFGVESFFIGTFRGIGNGFKRFGVGLYEMVTFPYAQDPILEEMSDWAY